MRLRKYGYAVIVGIVICLVVIWILGIFNTNDLSKIYRILSDGFFTASVLLIGFGLLTAISTTGVFNIFGYSALLLFSSLFSDTRKDQRPADFYEYTISKRGKKKAKWHIVITGSIFLILALLFLVLESNI